MAALRPTLEAVIARFSLNLDLGMSASAVYRNVAAMRVRGLRPLSH
jgi:hypothetical protein